MPPCKGDRPCSGHASPECSNRLAMGQHMRMHALQLLQHLLRARPLPWVAVQAPRYQALRKVGRANWARQ